MMKPNNSKELEQQIETAISLAEDMEKGLVKYG